MRLVLASNNRKKLVELQALLAPAGVELVTQASLGVPEADEPYFSFVENALTKARHAAKLTGTAAIADDSGLCVAALGGAPGVMSANFSRVEAGAGEREVVRAVQDAANNALLLERLAGVGDRRAHFISTLVALRAADDPEPLIAVGRWHGTILEAPRGHSGFGYDPLFQVDALGVAAAELSAEVKNAHSHRGVAARAMAEMLGDVWGVAGAPNRSRERRLRPQA